MARNPKRVYRYPVFDPASLVWQYLMKDAANMGKSVDDLIVIRLGDYYQGKRDKVPEQVVPEAPTNVAHVLDTTANARAAAQAWRHDEDEEDTPTAKMHAV